MAKNSRLKQASLAAYKKQKENKPAADVSAPFDMRKITGLKKNAPTWGLIKELAKATKEIHNEYVKILNDMQNSVKYKYFAALADRELFAYSETTLNYIRRDLKTWENTINQVMAPVENRNGKLYSQEDIGTWMEIYDQLSAIADGMKNTTVGAYALYDNLFNNFTYTILGLSIPEYLLLEDKDKREVAEITFTNAINKYNKENPEHCLPPFNEFYTAIENKEQTPKQIVLN